MEELHLKSINAERMLEVYSTVMYTAKFAHSEKEAGVNDWYIYERTLAILEELDNKVLESIVATRLYDGVSVRSIMAELFDEAVPFASSKARAIAWKSINQARECA